MQRFPLLPLEEEGRLNNLPLRENHIERLFAYYRWTGRALLGARRKHISILQHLMGYPKKDLSSEDKQELLGLIEDYRSELVLADRAAGAFEFVDSCYAVLQ